LLEVVGHHVHSRIRPIKIKVRVLHVKSLLHHLLQISSSILHKIGWHLKLHWLRDQERRLRLLTVLEWRRILCLVRNRRLEWFLDLYRKIAASSKINTYNLHLLLR